MFSMLSLFLLSFSFLHREIYIGRLEAQPASSPTHSLFLCKILMVEKNSTTTSFFLFLSSTATIPDRGLLFHIYIMVPCHAVWKSQKKYHSTLLTFWMDKSKLKMPKIVPLGEFLKIWSLRSNSVTRQVTFKKDKNWWQTPKCQEFKCNTSE